MSNSIVTITSLDVNLKTQQEGEYNLSLGERWEQILADYLSANGLQAYRACQRFVRAKVLKARRSLWNDCLEDGDYSEIRCELSVSGRDHYWRQMTKPNFAPHPTYKVLRGHPNSDWTLLRPYQRDVMVKISKIKRLSIEVKALTPSAFNRAFIQVGCCAKYDLKQFKVDAIVLINQHTAEAFAWTGDIAEMHRQRSANNDGSYSYAIEKAKLSPIDSWIDAIKDIYQLG